MTMAYQRSVLAEPAVVGLLRDQVALYLDKWGLADRVDEVALVVSECVTNAVNATPGEVIRFGMFRIPGFVKIEVTDPSADIPEPRQAGDVDEGGRGLMIVDALAESWGCRPHGGGKTTWALLRV